MENSTSRKTRFARALRRFVENPYTNLVKGLVLVAIGLAEASRTLYDDLQHGHLRVGHGLLIIGIFNILDALPHLLDGLDASTRYLARRQDGPDHSPPTDP